MNRFALAILAAAGLELAFGGILRPRHEAEKAPADWTFAGDWIATACVGVPRYDETFSFAPAGSDLESLVCTFAAQAATRDARFAAWLVARLEDRFAGILVGSPFRGETLDPGDGAAIETLRDAASAKAPILTLSYDYEDTLFPACSVRGYALGVVLGSRFLGVYREERVRLSQGGMRAAHVLVAHGFLDAQISEPALLRISGRPLAPAGEPWSETLTRTAHVPKDLTLESAKRRRGAFTVTALHGLSTGR